MDFRIVRSQTKPLSPKEKTSVPGSKGTSVSIEVERRIICPLVVT